MTKAELIKKLEILPDTAEIFYVYIDHKGLQNHLAVKSVSLRIGLNSFAILWPASDGENI